MKCEWCDSVEGTHYAYDGAKTQAICLECLLNNFPTIYHLIYGDNPKTTDECPKCYRQCGKHYEGCDNDPFFKYLQKELDVQQ